MELTSVFIVYYLHGDGSMDLRKIFSTQEKAETYIESQSSALGELIWEEEAVE